ncbi:MAG: LVIVD repeat-containing protein, partial [Chitinophagales bacterium]
ILLYVYLIFTLATLAAQTDTVELTYISEFYFENILPYSAFTSEFNKDGNPYVYSACRELGIVTFDISNIDSPFPVDTIPISALHNLNPTNISQHGNYLYCSVGGFEGLVPQKAGLAILDIDDPAAPLVTDVWDSTAFNQGAAIVISDGQFAYLGAMDEGVIILDVSNKSDIKFISSILPDPNFPEVPGLFSVPNARGLCFYSTDKLMVAYDAGGLRMIDISNKAIPLEIGKYVNTGIEDIAQSAYNNVAVVDHYAYVPVDMCGLDVVDISDENMENIYWYNPWNCDSSNWVGRPGHTNDIRVIGDSLLFVSAADSEVLIFDISNREEPKLVGEYANVYDSIAAWSADVTEDYISLALVNNEIYQIPFYSNKGGIAILEWNAIAFSAASDLIDERNFHLSPNPVTNVVHLQADFEWNNYIITDFTGKMVLRSGFNSTINCAGLTSGLFMISLFDKDYRLLGTARFIFQN